jgi:hypothetical protein
VSGWTLLENIDSIFRNLFDILQGDTIESRITILTSGDIGIVSRVPPTGIFEQIHNRQNLATYDAIEESAPKKSMVGWTWSMILHLFEVGWEHVVTII